MENYFMLYANCFLIEGAAECIIHDVHRQRFIPIKKRIANFLQKELKQYPVGKVLSRNPELREGIKLYLDLLVQKGYGFYTDEPHKFSMINLNFDEPYLLSSAIIELNPNSFDNYGPVIDELIGLGCQSFQFLFIKENYSFNETKQFLGRFKTSRVHTIDLYFADNIFDPIQYKTLAKDLRVYSTVFNQEVEESFFLGEDKSDKVNALPYLTHLKRKLDPHQKEKYGTEYFNFSLNSFIEAQEYNVGLNRKVSIGINGNIKNYLNHHKVFGNIEFDSIETIVKTGEFQKQWNIGNDQIEKCKNCQYRFLCFSNSFITEENGKFKKTDDCGFDPNENQWIKKSNESNVKYLLNQSKPVVINS